MNRREFIRLLAASTAVVAVDPSSMLKPKYPTLKPYSTDLHGGPLTIELMDKVLRQVRDNLNKNINTYWYYTKYQDQDGKMQSGFIPVPTMPHSSLSPTPQASLRRSLAWLSGDQDYRPLRDAPLLQYDPEMS